MQKLCPTLHTLLAAAIVLVVHMTASAADDEMSARQATNRIFTLPLDKISRRAPMALDEKPVFELHERRQPSQVVELRLDEVRRAILENQLEVHIEKIQPGIANEFVKEEEARFNSVFTATVGGNRTVDFTNLVGNGTSASIGTRIPLRSGGSISLSMPVSTQASAGSQLASAAVTLGFTQPLLRSAGYRINTAPLEKARLSAEQSAARAKLAVMNYLSNADRIYWRHWAAWQQVDIRYEQYELAKTQVKYAEEIVKAGLLARVDIIRSQSGVARRLEDILVTEFLRRQTERDLKRIMNRRDLPLGGQLTLIPANEPELVELSLVPQLVLDLALSNRMDLLNAQLQVVIDAISNEVAGNQLLPLFSFNLGYTTKNWDTSAGAALQGVRDIRYPDWSLGVSLEIPFDNAAARARLRSAALQKASNLETLTMRQLQIHKDVLDSLDQLEQSTQRILAARNEIRTANEIYTAELEQFKHGLSTSTDVLNAAQMIADAKIRNVNAIVDYELAKVDVAYATGTTLGYAGIELAR